MFNCQQMFSMPAQLHFSQKYLPRLIAVSLLSWPLAQAQGIDRAPECWVIWSVRDVRPNRTPR